MSQHLVSAKWLVLSGLALVAGVTCGAVENPLRSARVGDWVEYSTTVSAVAGMAMTMRKTVKAKDETSITLTIQTVAAGRKSPEREIKIALDKPFDPAAKIGPADAKAEKLAEGDETVTVGEKQYKCHWVQTRTTLGAMTMDAKAWICPDVPLGGLVKTETTTGERKTVMTLTGCGRGT